MPDAINIAAEDWNTADRIKRIFKELKQDATGKAYRPSPRFNRDEFWLKAAEHCNSAGADPYSFVRAAFLYNTVPGGPFPQQICSAAAARWYSDYARASKAAHGENAFEKEVQSRLIHALQTARSIRSKKPIEILRDELSGIDPYLRILLAPKDAVVWQRYSREARQTLAGNQYLLDVLRKMGFKDTLLDSILKS